MHTQFQINLPIEYQKHLIWKDYNGQLLYIGNARIKTIFNSNKTFLTKPEESENLIGILTKNQNT